MSRRKLFCGMAAVAAAFCAATLQLHAQRRVSEDKDLKELDLKAWPCKDEAGGSAKTPDGQERNTGKNRSPVPLAGVNVPKLDSTGFLRYVSAFDGQTRGRRRKDLSGPQLEQLKSIEQQIVSLTAYLVVAYAGPPESTNCGDVDFHDWHLELFEKPQDHAPRIGDPTPIICEVTPRTQSSIFRDGTRLRQLAGFIRTPEMENEKLGQPPQRVRITGYLLWDDEHNGASDVGTTVQKVVPASGYHQPWRSTAWEIHPILKIERADGSPMSAVT
ncbi:MAG: hypothetical protein M3Y80_08600, partial [Verrucomicrobiota bacterium]|nr:hypothetical protein [Verrucomicrobiota bacterium]